MTLAITVSQGPDDAMSDASRYSKIIEQIFLARYKDGAVEILFEREDIVRVAKKLGIQLPKNLGDVIYSFRYRTPLPESVRAKAPSEKHYRLVPSEEVTVDDLNTYRDRQI
jgi:hypothetical protein